MQVTPSVRQQFLVDGYIIVRGIIPDQQLPALRQQYEVLVEQMVHKSEEWGSSSQPRLNLSARSLSGLIDEQTIGCVEVWLPGSEVHRVSSQLLGVESASSYEMMMLCSPKREQVNYPAWHRDFEPRSTAPIGSFAADIMEGGPRHLSWNIPLYDDSLFWVLPGSHLRPLEPDEAALLDEDPSQPVPGSVQTFLRAGDGIAKITPILHWACRYSHEPLRRTIHGNYNVGMTTSPDYPRDLDFAPFLSPEHQAYFRDHRQRSARLLNDLEEALRAVLTQDQPATQARTSASLSTYSTAIGRMYPNRGPCGQILTTIFLSKAARQLRALHDPAFVGPGSANAEEEATRAEALLPALLQPGRMLADRFTREAAARLWDYFLPVDELLRGSEPEAFPHGRPGSEHKLRELAQRAASPYRLHEAPSELTMLTLFEQTR